MDNTNNDLAMLVGNGLSIAFNDELRLEKITKQVVERLETLGKPGSPIVHTFKAIAKRVASRESKPEENFEDLVGIFEAELLNIDNMQDLASHISPEDNALYGAFQQVLDFTNQIQTAGISHVLEIILEKSHATQDEAAELHSFVKSVQDNFPGTITIGNLNYDTLLLSSLMSMNDGSFADLGHGFNSHRVRLGPKAEVRVNKLRENSDFPVKARIKLLQMHGSVTFWREKSSGVQVKLKKELLVQHSLFKQLRDGDCHLEPLVVLSSSTTKPAKIRQDPYRLAYSIFEESLIKCQKWLIVGYSFRDESVNHLLRKHFHEGETNKELLIVTLGENPTSTDIANALGIEVDQVSDFVNICRDGAGMMTRSIHWEAFLRTDSD